MLQLRGPQVYQIQTEAGQQNEEHTTVLFLSVLKRTPSWIQVHNFSSSDWNNPGCHSGGGETPCPGCQAWSATSGNIYINSSTVFSVA